MARIPVGVVFPQTEIGDDPAAMKDFVQAAEGLGFSHVLVYDHVINADATNRPDWNKKYDIESMFQEPMVLMGFLAAATTRLRLATGVVILPQRQTVLFAKQAATLDVLCGGRLRLGVGLGWNQVEYDALGRSFETRGTLIDDQIRLLRRLWTERSISDKGEKGDNYDIIEAGLWPLPKQKPIPLWIGGFSQAAMNRAATIGDGWFPVVPPEQAAETVGRFREEVRKAGRDPAKVPMENLIFCRNPGVLNRDMSRLQPDKLAEVADKWAAAGVDSVCVDTMRMRLDDGKAHIGFIEQVAKEIGLKA